MRNIKRIHRICKKLEKLGNYYPDQRFGQLICNYIPISFYIEDEKESGMSKDTKYIEMYIDKAIKDIELYIRVCKETDFNKDVEKYGKKGHAGQKKNSLTWDELRVGKKVISFEPKHPEGKDYIKDLK